MLNHLKYLPHLAGVFFTATLATAVSTAQPILTQRLAQETTQPATTYESPPQGDYQPPPSGSFPTDGQFAPPPPSGDYQTQCPPGAPCPPPGGMMGPQPGMMGGPMFGPSEEEMKKMEEERARQEKEMRERGLKDMKRGIRQFSAQLKRMRTRIAAVQRQGVKLPPETLQLLDKAEAAAKIILEAENFETAQAAIEDMQSVGEELGNLMQNIEMLSHLPKAIGEAQKQVNRVSAAFKRLKFRAGRSKINTGELVTKIEQDVAALSAAVAKAKELVSQGQGEEAMSILEAEIFERLEDTWRSVSSAEAVLGINQFFIQANRDLRRYAAIIARMKRAKQDTARAEQLLEEAKAKVAALKERVKSAFEPEELFDELESMGELRDELEFALGIGEEFSVPDGRTDCAPKLQLPSLPFSQQAPSGAPSPMPLPMPEKMPGG